MLNILPTWNDQNIAKYNADLTPQTDDEGNFKPIVKGDIIEFSHLADIAKARTGTDKLAVLKMDVDNLGLLFQAQETIENTKKLSKKLKEFFEQKMLDLLKQQFEYVKDVEETTTIDTEGKEKKEKTIHKGKEKYIDNIYVVFSGGYDCFMLGAFDAVMEFAKLIRAEFEAFQTDLRKILPTIEKNITLSASLILVNGGFPVTRFAELAENALKEAKRKDTNKNKISVFGEVLTWCEFEKSHEIAQQLQGLVTEKGEPRGILDRVRNSAIGYEKLQNQAQQGKISMPKVWRLKYYLRNVRKENFEEMDKLFDEYITAILAELAGKQTTNPQTFRVAARWGEFLTRKDFSKTKNNENYDRNSQGVL